MNERGIKLIKEFEGCRLTAYKCPAGVWTIGYGHTEGVYSGLRITQETADKFLRNDLIKFETAVLAYNYLYKWNENEAAALTSFAFNCGTGSLKNLLKNGSRSRSEIRSAILLYNKDINGNYLPGLARRRKAELELFNTPCASVEAPEKEYKTVDDIVDGIWNGDFGTPWSKSDILYKYFLKKVNERRR